jgi:hypothetical protein
MTIRFSCANPGCNKGINAPDGSVGKKARCPHCGTVQAIPASSKSEDIFDLAEPEEATPPPQRRQPVETGASPREHDGSRRETSRGNTCAVCGTAYPAGRSCPRCRPAKLRQPSRWEGVDKQKYVTIITIAVIFGVLMVGAWWVIKNFAKTGGEYVGTLTDARDSAAQTQCEMNFHSVWTSIQPFLSSNDGKFPPSLDEYYSPSSLRCSAGNQEHYHYIPGQDSSMPAGNILLYESAGAHEGKCVVLRLNGAIDLLTPQQVQAAVDKTKRTIAAKKKAPAAP